MSIEAETVEQKDEKVLEKFPQELVEQVRSILKVEYDSRFQEELKATQELLKDEAKKTMTSAIQELQAKLKPPTAEELQKVLEQEYLEFKLKVGRGEEEKTFTIQELPQAVEKKFVKKAKSQLVTIASEIASLTLNLLEGDAARKVVAAMNSLEPLLDVVAELATIALNPYETDPDITKEWVQKNLSTSRIMAVVNAQLEANHIRDFLSLLSRSSSSLR